MEKCSTCGNAYDGTLKIHMKGKVHTFDSFEWAFHLLAPRCKNCNIRILGHGVESGSDIYCCSACARVFGVTDFRDHSEKPCHDCHNARANDTDQFSEEESDNDVATLKNIEKLLSKLTKKVAILEKKIED